MPETQQAFLLKALKALCVSTTLLLAPAAIEQQQLFIIHQRLNVPFLAIIKNISTGEFSYKTLT